MWGLKMSCFIWKGLTVELRGELAVGGRSSPGKVSVPRSIGHGWDGLVERGSDAGNGGELRGFYTKL